MIKRKILLIEDDLFIKDVFTEILTSQGYIVTAVTDGETAFQKIKDNGWDLILLDIILPKLNGLEIIQRLTNEDPEKLKQKIILTTNLEDSKELMELTKQGYSHIVKSNLQPEEFLNKIKLHLC